MAIIDSSYIELARLVARPLTEEFEYPWNIIRSCFWGLVPIAVLSLITGSALDPTPQYIKAKSLFGEIALWSGLLSIAIYAACGWQAYKLHLAREASITHHIKKFRD